jgi:hypothetical protein
MECTKSPAIPLFQTFSKGDVIGKPKNPSLEKRGKGRFIIACYLSIRKVQFKSQYAKPIAQPIPVRVRYSGK